MDTNHQHFDSTPCSFFAESQVKIFAVLDLEVISVPSLRSLGLPTETELFFYPLPRTMIAKDLHPYPWISSARLE